jgi:hypothetical protein
MELWSDRAVRKPAVYPYYCMFHGGHGGKEMSGVVTVEAATHKRARSP